MRYTPLVLLLHGAWLPRTGLALWGETTTLTPSKTHHPFAATPEELQGMLPIIDLAPTMQTLTAWLPSRGKQPESTRPFWLEKEPPASTKRTLKNWHVPALVFDARNASSLLLHLRIDDETPNLACAEDVRFWQRVARFALEVLIGQQFVPALVEEEKRWCARWQPLFTRPEVAVRLQHLTGAMPPSARAVRLNAEAPEIGPNETLRDFVSQVVEAVARKTTAAQKTSRKTPKKLAEQWWHALAAANPQIELTASFLDAYQLWARPLQSEPSPYRLCFRLDPPAAKSDWTLHYFLQPHDDPSLLVPAERVWRERGRALKYLQRHFAEPQEKLLAGLGLAARLFPPIENSLKNARPESAALTTAHAYEFVREAAPLLQGVGFGVLLPGLNHKLNVRLKLRPATPTPKGGVASLGFDKVIAFDWEIALGDQTLTREELERLAALKEPLVQVRGQWMELRPEQMEQALAFLNQNADAALPLDDALRLLLNPQVDGGLPVTSVTASDWVAELQRHLTEPTRLKPLAPPPNFVGTLRAYQQHGVAWLTFLRQFGLGACLADDMGLGKTPTTIAFLLHTRHKVKRPKPALVVCPTSVVGNWQRELKRFAPHLKVLVHHGVERAKTDFATEANAHDVVLTSYVLLHRDAQHLREVQWSELILDEAQNIKNPETHQAKAARQLPAEHRVALTGTPIENRLAELWSLFHFINPAYLGAQAHFTQHFARPIERLQDAAATQKLKALTSPFILRRVKTDPTVIQDLPLKNEMKVFCNLTREQATLYQAVVRDSLQQIAAADGIQRRGLVLATLLRLKQVCNHPAHFLGDHSVLAERSGKLNRLVEMLAEVRAVQDRALIFTQFTEMGEMLQAHLGAEVVFLHGGTPLKTRTRMVERFQHDPHGPLIFLLSIKAGGTGLNLTRANHVFHFDRWWNPAVENQATDRAFRIGQKKNVQVHKFICAGTVEERLDAMIERKTALAQSIVGASEAWITELSTNELRNLFTLRAESVE